MWLVMGPGVDLESLDEMVMAGGEEARRAGMPLVVHATELEPAKLALKAGANVLVHGVWDEVVDAEFLSLLKANDAVYVPTHIVGRGYLRMHASAALGEPIEIDDPNGCVAPDLLRKIASTPSLANGRTPEQIATLRERIGAREEISAANMAKVAAARRTIAVGTDAGNPLTLHGPSIYRELEAMESAGLSPARLLVMATRNGARAMGRDDLGTIEPGRSADLLILRANPLESVRNLRQLEAVVLRGVVRGVEELAALPE